jgi:hypothetical protein
MALGTDRWGMRIEYSRKRQFSGGSSGLRGKGCSLEKQEPVGRDAKASVMMKASPASPP